MIIKCSNIELLQHLEQPVCWEPLTGVDFTFSTPRLMPRLYINPVGLVQVLVLGGFQNWFLELYFKGKMVVELSVLGSKANQESTTLWCQELLWHWSCGSNKHNPPWPYWEIFCLTPCTSELSITQTCGLRYPTCILRYHQRGLRNHKRSTCVVFKPLPTSAQLVFSSSYLHALNAQWFMLFDPYAELQTCYPVQTEE
jgi:hypothetical protein